MEKKSILVINDYQQIIIINKINRFGELFQQPLIKAIKVLPPVVLTMLALLTILCFGTHETGIAQEQKNSNDTTNAEYYFNMGVEKERDNNLEGAIISYNKSISQ